MHVEESQLIGTTVSARGENGIPRRQALEWLRLQWQLVRPFGRYAYYALFPQRRPEYFRKAWNYPHCPLADPSAPGRFSVKTSDDFTLFFLPMVDWHARMQRSQHLAKAFAELGIQCVYVNPNLGLEYRKPYAMDPQTRVSLLESAVSELHIHLPREPASHARLLTPGETARVTAEIKRLIQARNIRNAMLIISLPVWLDVGRQLRRRYGFQILYDCHDWLPGFDRLSPQIVEGEEGLLKSCDFLVCSSQRLIDAMSQKAPIEASKIALIRNAVDPRHFQTCQNGVAGPHQPTVGYAGALDRWFDVEAVMEAAKNHPHWKFVLVGLVEDRKIWRLENCGNVQFVGEVPYEAIPAYLSSWNVAMIPFLHCGLTEATNPIKLYEYLSAGLPVVSSSLPEVELFGDLVYLADTPSQFSAMIARAMRENNPVLQAKRRAIAGRETWAARAQSMLKMVAPQAMGR